MQSDRKDFKREKQRDKKEIEKKRGNIFFKKRKKKEN